MPTIPDPPRLDADMEPEGSHHELLTNAQSLNNPTDTRGKTKARAKKTASRSKPYEVKEKKPKKKADKQEEEAPQIPMIRLPDEPELSEVIDGVRYFVVYWDRHTSLFSQLPTRCSPYDTDTTKYVSVTYSVNFERKPRFVVDPAYLAAAAASQVELPKRRRGRPKIGHAWKQLHPDALCCCGRHYSAVHSYADHVKYGVDKGTGKTSVSCNLLEFQGETKSDNCRFCSEVIGRDASRFEEHFRICKTVAELRTLIRKRHLEDDGLLECEIRKANWPWADKKK